MPAFKLEALIDALLTAEVEFVLIGGAAAVLHGAPVVTGDIDIVHRKTPENIARLLGVLLPIHARARADRRNLPPTASALQGRGHVLLDTDLGPVDVLCEIGDGQDYDWLLPRSELLDRGAGVVRVVELRTLIELKVAAGRVKDRLTVPILVATLEERERRGREADET
ncbi:MAG: hypothetical protein U0326_13160 [Polyangiales bacterium]